MISGCQRTSNALSYLCNCTSPSGCSPHNFRGILRWVQWAFCVFLLPKYNEPPPTKQWEGAGHTGTKLGTEVEEGSPILTQIFSRMVKLRTWEAGNGESGANEQHLELVLEGNSQCEKTDEIFKRKSSFEAWVQVFPQDMAFVLVLVSFVVAKGVLRREQLMAHSARVYWGAPDETEGSCLSFFPGLPTPAPTLCFLPSGTNSLLPPVEIPNTYESWSLNLLC